MIVTNFSRFLSEIGLTEIQIKIYNYLLTHKFGTINDIKNELNYSYTQVHHNLITLEEKGLISLFQKELQLKESPAPPQPCKTAGSGSYPAGRNSSRDFRYALETSLNTARPPSANRFFFNIQRLPKRIQAKSIT